MLAGMSHRIYGFCYVSVYIYENFYVDDNLKIVSVGMGMCASVAWPRPYSLRTLIPRTPIALLGHEGRVSYTKIALS